MTTVSKSVSCYVTNFGTELFAAGLAVLGTSASQDISPTKVVGSIRGLANDDLPVTANLGLVHIQ